MKPFSVPSKIKRATRSNLEFVHLYLIGPFCIWSYLLGAQLLQVLGMFLLSLVGLVVNYVAFTAIEAQVRQEEEGREG